jgi:hypothetical protein
MQCILMVPHNSVYGKRVLGTPFDPLLDDNSATPVFANSPVETISIKKPPFLSSLMLTQGTKKLTSDAHEARIADSRKVALRPSM